MASSPANPKMELLEERLRSFPADWDQHCPVTPADLAQAGFFHGQSSNGDLVSCFQCGLELQNWEVEDVPVQEHFEHSPQCPHISSLADRCDAVTASPGDRGTTTSDSAASSGSEVKGNQSLCCPFWSTLNKRLDSFNSQHCPEELRRAKAEFAQAGFFHENIEDGKLRTFCCGQRWLRRGSLTNLDPWDLHRRLASQGACAFLRQYTNNNNK